MHMADDLSICPIAVFQNGAFSVLRPDHIPLVIVGKRDGDAVGIKEPLCGNSVRLRVISTLQDGVVQNLIVIYRLSAKGTDEVMKHRYRFARSNSLLY